MIKITAKPNLLTVGAGESVTYRIEPAEATLFSFVDPKDAAVWIAGEETDYRTIVNWVRGGVERTITFDRPGKYAVFAILQLPDGDPRLGGSLFRPVAEYEQNVQPTESFMWDPLRKERSHVQDPTSAVAGVLRYLKVLNGVGGPLQFDLSQAGQAAWNKHLKVVEKYQNYLDKLQERLASTNDWIRLPLTATHKPDGDSRAAELNVFLAKKKDDGIVKHWKVVDWTHPGDKNLDGEYDGSGVTDSDAVKEAIRAWEQKNNYPKGLLSYEIPANVVSGASVTGSFSTTGRSFLGKVADFLEKAGIFLAIVAIILTVAPIPGSQVAAAALWLGIFSGVVGAAAAGLNIAERHLRGVADENADVTDALTIAGCMLGFAGTWVRGAKVAMQVSGTVRELVLVGEVGAATVQGVMMAESTLQEAEQVINDKSLSPDERIKKMLVILGKAAAQGGMIYVNVKGTIKDAARLTTPKPPPPKKPPPSPHGEKPTGSPEENLKKLKDPKQKVDLTEDPAVTGNTKAGNHTTTVHANPPRARVTRKSFAERFPEDKKFYRTRSVDRPNFIMIRHRFHLAPNDPGADLWFVARLTDEGIIHVDLIKTSNWRVKETGQIVTESSEGARLELEGKAEPIKSSFFDGSPALVAKELYPMMFDHFEAGAAKLNIEIKGIDGSFAFSNYQEWKAAVKAGAEPAAAILEKTKTGPLWKAELDSRGYKYKMAPGFPKEDTSSELVDWKFDITK